MHPDMSPPGCIQLDESRIDFLLSRVKVHISESIYFSKRVGDLHPIFHFFSVGLINSISIKCFHPIHRLDESTDFINVRYLSFFKTLNWEIVNLFPQTTSVTVIGL